MTVGRMCVCVSTIDPLSAWCMGRPGRLCGADDVLRDGSGPSEPPNGERFTDGEGSVGDVPKMSGVAGMSGMGDTTAGTRVRPYRWRYDSERAVAVETRRTVKLRDVVDAHRDTATLIYRHTGKLFPRLWAESSKLVTVLEPLNSRSTMVSDWERAQLLTAICRSEPMTVIGRTDEAFVKETEAGMFASGDLHLLADIDPTIKTALLIHALDVFTQQGIVSMAILELDDDGFPKWVHHDAKPDMSAPMLPLSATGKLLRENVLRQRMSVSQADEIIEDMGWRAVRMMKGVRHV